MKMPKQKILLTKVQVNKYKSIETQQVFDVEEAVTTLVGKNEAGKTAVLEAIAKTNYFEDDPKFKFDATYDYPRKERKKFTKSEEDVTVVTSSYKISDAYLREIQSSVGKNTFNVKEFTCSRAYLSDSWTYTGISANKAEFLKHKLKQYGITDPAFSEEFMSLNTLAEVEALETKTTEDAHKKLAGFTKSYFKSAGTWSNPIESYIVWVWIKPAQSKFLYYDAYYELPSEIEIKKLQNEQLQEEELKTSKALFELADINIDELVAGENYEPYKAELEATSNEITSKLFDYWKTNTNLRVDFDIENRL
jgi:predicted ATP-dependent endonuclease of OLD family